MPQNGKKWLTLYGKMTIIRHVFVVYVGGRGTKVMLAEEIEKVRRNLVKLGMEKGLQHPEVLEESRNLDVLIVKFLVGAVAAPD